MQSLYKHWIFNSLSYFLLCVLVNDMQKENKTVEELRKTNKNYTVTTELISDYEYLSQTQGMG